MQSSTNVDGSRHAITTTGIPAARIRSVHGSRIFVARAEHSSSVLVDRRRLQPRIVRVEFVECGLLGLHLRVGLAGVAGRDLLAIGHDHRADRECGLDYRTEGGLDSPIHPMVEIRSAHWFSTKWERSMAATPSWVTSTNRILCVEQPGNRVGFTNRGAALSSTGEVRLRLRARTGRSRCGSHRARRGYEPDGSRCRGSRGRNPHEGSASASAVRTRARSKARSLTERSPASAAPPEHGAPRLDVRQIQDRLAR